MSKLWIALLATLALLAACAAPSQYDASPPPAPVAGAPGKAVIYIVRTRPDMSYLAAPIGLDGRMLGASYAGTYFRVEVDPGRHRIEGYAQDNGSITLDVRPDRIYYVQHTVSGSWRATSPMSFFSMMNEARARQAIAHSIPAS